jgi:hypothetical protein
MTLCGLMAVAFDGPALAYNDGSANAPTGTPQYPHLLDSYTLRPPWQVAGVDYYVGYPAGTVLKDPTVIANLPAGASRDTTNHMIRINASNVTLDGFDFSLHGGYAVYIANGSWTGTRIINSYFKVPGFAVLVQGTAANTYVGYCVIDGDSATSCVVGELLSIGNGATVEYNWIKNAPQHFLSSGGNGTVVYRYNLLDQGAFCPGAHLNYLQFGGGVSPLVDVEFNTTYQLPQAAGGEGFQFYNNGGSSNDSSICAYNTMLAVGNGTSSQAMSYMLHGGGTAGICHDNYFDPTSSYGAIYPNSFTGWTVCSNYNMKTGQLLSGESACATSIRDIAGQAADCRITVWPNPFSGRVEFLVPDGRNATIAIFYAHGGLVKQFAGRAWDGTDRQGTAVRAGVYMYRLTTGKDVQCGKIFKQDE